MAVVNSETPQESSIYNFACLSPENIDTLYMKVVVIPSLPRRTITNNIDFLKYDENYAEYQDKWEVDSDWEVGPFFMPFKMRRSLAMAERILNPWEGRDKLKLNITLGSLFQFRTTRSIQ